MRGLLGSFEESKEDKGRLKLLQLQLKEKQKKIERYDDDIVNLLKSKEDLIEEVEEAGTFKAKIQEVLVWIEDRLKAIELTDRPLMRADSEETLSITGN